MLPSLHCPSHFTEHYCVCDPAKPVVAPLPVSVALVLFGGLMSGLTLGLMSLDAVQLEILKRTGSSVEKERAARIMPVRRLTQHDCGGKPALRPLSRDAPPRPCS